MSKPDNGVQFLVPKEVPWKVDDVYALETEGNYREALERWNVLLTPFQDSQLKRDPRFAGLKSHRTIWLHIGICYRHLEIFSKAIEAYDKAMVLSEEAKDPSTLAQVHNGLGVVYRHMGDIKEALRHNKKALRRAKSILDMELIVTVHDNIAHCYLEKDLSKKALKEEMKAYGILSRLPSRVSPRIHARVLGNLGHINWTLGKHRDGIVFMEKGLVKAREAGDHNQESLILEYLQNAK